MLLHIPEVLKPEQALEARRKLEKADWADGKLTAGVLAAPVKSNQEVPKDHPVALEVGRWVLEGLKQNALFSMAALPLKISTPLFNRYQAGQGYGFHVDNAMRPSSGDGGLMRSDLSATLFLSDPSEYGGGELTVADTYGLHEAKLPAGHLLLYPAGSLHQVKPVTQGVRYASFLWVQSSIQDETLRGILMDLDLATQQLLKDHPGHVSALRLLGVYNNLLRRYGEA